MSYLYLCVGRKWKNSFFSVLSCSKSYIKNIILETGQFNLFQKAYMETI